jgi:hypothetical protein
MNDPRDLDYRNLPFDPPPECAPTFAEAFCCAAVVLGALGGYLAVAFGAPLLVLAAFVSWAGG